MGFGVPVFAIPTSVLIHLPVSFLFFINQQKRIIEMHSNKWCAIKVTRDPLIDQLNQHSVYLIHVQLNVCEYARAIFFFFSLKIIRNMVW